jgi:hypothetical protein
MGVCSFSLDGPSLLLFIGRRFRELEQKFGISFVFDSVAVFAQLSSSLPDRSLLARPA